MTKRTDAPSAEVRIRVFKRDRFQCTYCGAPGTDVELEVDHIIAVAKGGSNHMSNLTTACRACNQGKSDGPPQVRKASKGSGLVGLFVHTLSEGRINYQGHIGGLQDDYALVQLFSWWTGEPTKIEPMLTSFLLSKECILYPDREAMLLGYLQQEERLGRLVGTLEENMRAYRAYEG